jgi:hypothetical protein
VAERLAVDQQSPSRTANWCIAACDGRAVTGGVSGEDGLGSGSALAFEPGGGQQLAVDLAVGVARQRAGHGFDAGGTM